MNITSAADASTQAVLPESISTVTSRSEDLRLGTASYGACFGAVA